MANKAWIVVSISGKRQYAGNSGYLDEVQKTYPYDSNVGNHKRISIGDLIVIRDRRFFLGISIIYSYA